MVQEKSCWGHSCHPTPQVQPTLSSCCVYEEACAGTITLGLLSGPRAQVMQSLMGI